MNHWNNSTTDEINFNKFTFPDNLEVNAPCFFQFCEDFTEVTVPEQLKSICWKMFAGTHTYLQVLTSIPGIFFNAGGLLLGAIPTYSKDTQKIITLLSYWVVATSIQCSLMW